MYMVRGRKTEIQNIRQSNFVLTYGPGAIIETKKGARLIPMPDKYGLLARGGVSSNLLKRYEITDTRMSAVIRAIMNRERSVHIFRIPTSSDKFFSAYENIIYGTHIFPRYFICYNAKAHKKKGFKEEFVLFYANSPEAKCPVCGETVESSKHISQVRFIMACPKGHMDEVDWNRAVHRDKACGKTLSDMWFYWKPEGSTLDSIIIECPDCGSTVTMGEIYRKSFKCTGRFPEEEWPIYKGKSMPPPPYLTDPDRRGNCDEYMKVIQRQSSALRSPVTISLLTIPKLDRRIAELLQNSSIRRTMIHIMKKMDVKNPGFISALEEELQIDVDAGELTSELKEEFINILKNKKSELLDGGVLIELMERLIILAKPSENISFMNYIYEEFDSILEAASNALYSPHSSENGNFSIAPKISVKPTEYTPELDVYPVEKLRTVTAQIGYVRSIYNCKQQCAEKKDTEWGVPQVKDIGYRDGYSDEVWYPGYIGSGEGIFITFSNPEDIQELLDRRRDIASLWIKDTYHENYKRISPWSEVAYKPIFVWLHTLSHSLIKAIYMTSGYSMASIRERIYLSRDHKNGGILLYTTSPSADGSMGGLVSIVKNMNDILRKAINSLKVCSNDPLCIAVYKKPENPNGAACYSCLFVSETSCEHGNRWLDRHIIVG
ncbi:MAG: DUF1998 domain-containing protein [Thermoplasmata archaeon]|nr:DUF1998 domain-containing protein [Thermoplasmata archaeon]